MGDRRPRYAIEFSRYDVGDPPRLGVAAAANVGAPGGHADPLLCGAAAAGAGFRKYLLHVLLVGGGSLAVCSDGSALRVFAGASATLAQQLRCRPKIGFVLCLGPLLVLGGSTYRQSRMYAGAETLYQATIAQNPDCWMVHNNLGLVLAGRGKVDEAISEYQKAVEIEPYDAEAHNNLGNALAGRGQVDGAIARYQRALEIKPGYAEAHYNLGNALLGRGKFDAAVAEFRTALQLKPDYAKAHASLGNAMIGRGHLDAAVGEYLTARKSIPMTLSAITILLTSWPAADKRTRQSSITKRSWKLRPTI